MKIMKISMMTRMMSVELFDIQHFVGEKRHVGWSSGLHFNLLVGGLSIRLVEDCRFGQQPMIFAYIGLMFSFLVWVQSAAQTHCNRSRFVRIWIN